ncbi:hypothetical protein FK498_04000 [Elioraea sp. Yellowstone]|jgi:hypothetical protein|uniref:DUF6644 family protein n=1 Tax=Elioraea sp. Yellowstone TaxID=2592070 RepID=UPI001150D688|nr:DUF6644 family protein [Elioraea sp. Yellowstone]TQF82528.1 hypothetical protein FK498_04000 [Elioraea sp. Yellowstone]
MEHGTGISPPDWAVWLEASALGEVARNSLWLYPAASIAHVLGIALLVGSIVSFDLRVLGVARAVPFPAAARLLLPVARTGFAIIVASGAVMLAADATHVATNDAFAVKMVLVVLALTNVLFFHRVAWPAEGQEPGQLARTLAAFSATLWLGVASSGRAIAYF